MNTQKLAKWKEVTIGGVSGIALGAAGTLFASSVATEASAAEVTDEEALNETEEGNAEENGGAGTAQQATGTYDSMSFGQAFTAARAEVGPGGVFEWHGNLYGTYTAEEWASMDATARDEYYASIHWDGPSHQYVASNNHHSTSTHSGDVHQTAQVEQTPEKEDDPEVEIIGIEHANIDGEHDSIIGTASINGQSVYFVDVDGEDDEFELMVADVNNNNQIEENEVIDISQQHVSVSHFEQMAQANQPAQSNEQEEPVHYYANNEDLPDYVNDADPGTLA